jgi:PAS domain S-box-containing protein
VTKAEMQELAVALEMNRLAEPSATAGLPSNVLDQLLEGCQVISVDHRYLYVNEVLAKQARKAKAELIGRSMQECYPGIEQTPMFAMLERCLETRCADRMENEFTFPDGTRTCFELRFVPVPEGVCILSLDITERHNRLAAIVNDSDDAIIGRTLDGSITSWNAGAETLFGYAASEMIGTSFEVLRASETASDSGRISERLLRGERIAHFETQARRKDGQIVQVSVTLSPIRDARNQITGVSLIARDITAFKQVEMQLVRAKEAAEAASRELESFSYSVAHDLRAPLRGIDGFSQTLLDEHAHQLDATGQSYLRRVRQSAQRMAILIDDMLALYRVTSQELERSSVDLSELARETLARLANTEPGRHVEVVIEEGLEAQADPRLLGLVFDNLLGNAWKFSAKRHDARIELGRTEQRGERCFFVSDNGAGFDMAYVDKLFGIFQRLHNEREFPGTGMGLAIVERAVQRHGGRVWAESTVGVGATFYFTLA